MKLLERPMVTLKQVAKRAGCSTATASRVLNASGAVSDAVVLRVRQAAAEVGYIPPAGLSRSPRRPVIGVLVPSVTNPIFAQSLSSIQNRMMAAGYIVIIAQSNYDPDRETEIVAGLLRERPTGLILTVCDSSKSPILDRDLPPTVLLNNLPTKRIASAVTVDNHQAGRELTHHLMALGHKRILFVGGVFRSSDRAAARYAGHCEALSEAGLERFDPVEISFVNDYDKMELGKQLAAVRPTAIIGSNDLIALGVLAAVRREGLHVPDDISVAGFDGIAIGRLIQPQLTTIDMPDSTMGATAASLLLDMVENNAPPRRLQLDYSLRRGTSVSACRDETAESKGPGGSGSGAVAA